MTDYGIFENQSLLGYTFNRSVKLILIYLVFDFCLTKANNIKSKEKKTKLYVKMKLEKKINYLLLYFFFANVQYLVCCDKIVSFWNEQ